MSSDNHCSFSMEYDHYVTGYNSKKCGNTLSLDPLDCRLTKLKYDELFQVTSVKRPVCRTLNDFSFVRSRLWALILKRRAVTLKKIVTREWNHYVHARIHTYFVGLAITPSFGAFIISAIKGMKPCGQTQPMQSFGAFIISFMNAIQTIVTVVIYKYT